MTKRERKPKLTRRQFLRGAGTAAVAAGVAAVSSGCGEQRAVADINPLPRSLPTPLQYPGIPSAPAEPPTPGTLRFFTPHEARTVEALTARILPGTPEDPGAREAGVVTYIDHMLSYPEGYGENVYRQPPFAQVYQGSAPPPEAESGPYQVVWVSGDEIERYGLQSTLTPREVYRLGVMGVDRFAQERFGRRFVQLSEQEQDEIVGAMAEGQASGFTQMTGEQFFHVLRRHTMEGMFSDPAYGGNRGFVGWRLVGYPGAQRAYTPGEIQAGGPPRPPQGLHDMSHFYAGSPAREGVVLPLSGSDPDTWHDAHGQPAREGVVLPLSGSDSDTRHDAHGQP
ncbi:MAG TPA: gluconate 2-dehydrogenase subunit 3 family protein [Roseiflexaceae bacterium]|nr:gluconate 2-dehydrogenase subunit 3 family protein [Roseiflexaceae bacterium]